MNNQLVLYSASNILLIHMHCITIALLLLCLAALLPTSLAYGLDGQWLLRTEEISQLSPLKHGIVFHFQRNVNQQGNITAILQVHACKYISYEYGVEDDQLFLRFVGTEQGTGTFQRTCEDNEISYLRTTLDSIFYFYILDRVLLLLTPTGMPIKLDRILDLSRPSLNSQFTITSAFTFDPIEDPVVVANGTHLALCKGKALFSYRTLSTQNIVLKKLTNHPCNGLLTELLEGATIIRVQGNGKGRVVRLYDQNVNMILQMKQQKDYSYTGQIRFDNVTAVETSLILENVWDWDAIREISSNSVVVKEVKRTTSPSTKTITETISESNSMNTQNNNTNTEPNKQILNSSDTPEGKTSTSPANQKQTEPVSSKQPQTSIETTQSSTTQQTPTPTAPTPQKQPAPTAQPSSTTSDLTFQPVVSPTDIYGFWYPIWSTPGQLIINSARLMIISTCTAFSSYRFTSSSFTDLSIVTAQPQCDLPLRNMIFNPQNVYYLAAAPKTLQIRDKTGKKILQLSSTPK